MCVSPSVPQQTENAACLKKFLAFQGLPLLWSWMVESSDLPASQQNEMRMQVPCVCVWVWVLCVTVSVWVCMLDVFD